MSFYFVQFVTGLASACSLFLVASGLSIIFGVTRVVNFAHGAFYMLGAYIGYTLTERLSGGVGFWGAIVLGALVVAAIGTLSKCCCCAASTTRRNCFSCSPPLASRSSSRISRCLIWGPSELLGPRAPGFKGAIDLFGQPFPTYDLLLIALAPLVLAFFWVLFRRTTWGVLVRAATQDREMVAALGVNQKWLFTSVFALGVFLAGLGGALELPRQAANHTMDLQVITEALVVVVIGGLGSVPGTFLAAIIVSELNAFGILVFPKISIVLVFLVMAIVLIVRPWGLLGRAEAAARTASGAVVSRWRPFGAQGRLLAILIALAVAALLPLVAGNYLIGVATEVLIFMLYAASLHFLLAGGGLVSFGHAAYFGLGSYGAAIALKAFGLGMETAIPAGILLGFAGALVFGWFCVRLSGVYFAMLTLAFAQIAWSIAYQWTEVTGGDNGIIGVWPSAWAASPARFYWLTLALSAGGVALLRAITFSPFGYALRALRDSTLRAETIGIERRRVQWMGFVNRRRFRGAGGGALRLSQGQRVSGQHLDFAVDRRARHGPARRRRHGVGRRRGRRDLSVAVDLGDQPHRLFQARARRPHHPAGCAVPSGPRRRVRSLAKRAGACSPSWRKPMSILVVEELGKSYSGFQAVRNVSFVLEASEMLALIGPNGAGKSTCFAMIDGQLAPTTGRIAIFGKSTAGMTPGDIWRLGVGRTFQVAATFASMTVAENVQMALISHHTRRWLALRWAARYYVAEAERLLDLVGMADQAQRSCGELAYGDLKRLELAVALANDPKLLLMDEPAAGMAPRERHALMGLTVRIARERTIGVLFTEHDMDVVFGHADRVLVLNRGTLIAEGAPAAVRANAEVQAVYLGAGSLYGADS